MIDLPLLSCSTANLADTVLSNSAQSNYSKGGDIKTSFQG